eukprot:101628-Pelagomonas_calceolata.AAC.1
MVITVAQLQAKYSRANNKCKIALNRLAALVNLPSTEELNTEVIQKFLAHKNSEPNVPQGQAAVHCRINNTHISGLINTQLNEECNPSVTTHAQPQRNNNRPTQVVPTPQPSSTTHYRHECTGRCLLRTPNSRLEPTINPSCTKRAHLT